MSNGLLHLLEFGLVIAVSGVGLYWAFGAASRFREKRREGLTARAQYRQPWNPDTTWDRSNR